MSAKFNFQLPPHRILLPAPENARPVSQGCDVEEIADVLADDTAREILTTTSIQAQSANALSDECGVSGPTIYRRLEDLRACDLIEEQTRPDPTGGHHHKVYAPNLDRVTVELHEGEMTVQIHRQQDMADRFTELIEGM